MSENTTDSHDAILLVSFGGPEKPDEVIDFLENVTRGSGIPRERLATVGEHYYLFGGRSPINDQNKALMAALEAELVSRGHQVPVYWGNRNWHPFIDEALDQLVADGRRQVLMLSTSAYPSYSGCRSYREALAESLARLPDPPQVERIGHYGLDDGFVAANAAALQAAAAQLPGARVVFVTHSIPTPMEDSAGPDGQAYTAWHREVAERVFARAGLEGEWDFAYCSRSGRPTDPWLEPDVNDHLEQLHEQGINSVVLAPIGFISDHMEVIYDLDTEARKTCERLGIEMVRAATAGTHEAFVRGLADRIEWAMGARGPEGLSEQGNQLGRARCGGEGCCRNLRRPETPAID
ncbi:ferrochelatase [Luteococcus peritonei]|uniref:Coproporphyrin III ferrochelatase n=1 Tax=Luteococcus peritonei TaxID=88874 RepID=A0ABW4RXT1_9ACTN